MDARLGSFVAWASRSFQGWIWLPLKSGHSNHQSGRYSNQHKSLIEPKSMWIKCLSISSGQIIIIHSSETCGNFWGWFLLLTMIPGLGRTEVVMKFAQISGSYIYISNHIYMVVIIYPDYINQWYDPIQAKDSKLNIPFLAQCQASPTVGGVIPSQWIWPLWGTQKKEAPAAPTTIGLV
jgi:hypothetical protein